MGLLLLGHHGGLLLRLLLSVEVEKVPQGLLMLLELLRGHGLELVLYRQLAEFKPTIIVLRWHPSTSALRILLFLSVAPIKTRCERILSNFLLGWSRTAAPSRPEIKVCRPSRLLMRVLKLLRLLLLLLHIICERITHFLLCFFFLV